MKKLTLFKPSPDTIKPLKSKPFASASTQSKLAQRHYSNNPQADVKKSNKTDRDFNAMHFLGGILPTAKEHLIKNASSDDTANRLAKKAFEIEKQVIDFSIEILRYRLNEVKGLISQKDLRAAHNMIQPIVTELEELMHSPLGVSAEWKYLLADAYTLNGISLCIGTTEGDDHALVEFSKALTLVPDHELATKRKEVIFMGRGNPPKGQKLICEDTGEIFEHKSLIK